MSPSLVALISATQKQSTGGETCSKYHLEKQEEPSYMNSHACSRHMQKAPLLKE